LAHRRAISRRSATSIAICKDLGVDYAKSTILYQSQFFEQVFPEENKHFGNTVIVPAIEDDRAGSLLRMRTEMLSRGALSAAVFIGGMEGVEEEFTMFRQFHPNARVLSPLFETAFSAGSSSVVADRHIMRQRSNSVMSTA
jgi:hypothetical protein